MYIIAHRGLLRGPDKEKENNPEQIEKALNAGFDVEVDVRMKDGKLWLGHDFPQYEMPSEYLKNSYHFWFHCKDFESFAWFQGYNFSGEHITNFFWHDTDDYVFTSLNWIWVYPGKPLVPQMSICVLPELDEDPIRWRDAAGVCTDWPGLYQVGWSVLQSAKGPAFKIQT